MNKVRSLYVRWLVWRGKAVNIYSKGEYPVNALSNLCGNKFELDGFLCGSMEGFLQSLKYADRQVQHQVCQMKGRKARQKSTNTWKVKQQVFWNGETIERNEASFQLLLRRAYRAMFDQNECFRNALLLTRGKRLFHTRGAADPYETILTEQEFCRILTELRDSADKVVEPVDAWVCYRKQCPFRVLCK